jgi:hypothetical protein
MRVAAAAAVLFAVGLIVTVGRGSGAEEQRMTSLEIREALSGNSVKGLWGNTPFHTYFQPNGVMLHKPRGGPLETGKWSVDETQDLYCSWTARAGWRCYELYRDGRTIVWSVPGGKERYLSEILGGRQF